MYIAHKSYKKGYGRRGRIEPDYDRCCVEIYKQIFSHQCKRKKGFGPDGHYCRLHAKKVEG